MTNADYIRSMDDETLADFTSFICQCEFHGDDFTRYTIKEFQRITSGELREFDTDKWLKSEVEL